VRDFTSEIAPGGRIGHREAECFTHNDGARIAARIAATSPDPRVVLVGHSWGGHTAAVAAAALGQQGRPVDTLITVDLVSANVTEDHLRSVRTGSREWLNIRAHGAPSLNASDVVAWVGQRYGDAPSTYV
jgi:pimeloyl-ACP methyl ester carboxylesterase